MANRTAMPNRNLARPLMSASLIAIPPAVARVAEQEPGCHLVAHVTELRTLPLPGRENHEVGIAA